MRVPAFIHRMKTSLKALLQPAIQAVRTYWPAILLIQSLALCVVLSYYKLAGAAAFFGKIAEWKTGGGLLFAASSTIVSGGIIPEVLKRFFRPQGVPAPNRGELIHQFMMWAWLGILVDRFYWLQGQVFGMGNDIATLLSKVLADQFIFTPFVSLPLIVSWFLLYESKYHPGRWIAGLSPKRITSRILPLWATCLSFWPIMLLTVFSLPSELQFPLFLFGNSAYSILMIFIARRQSETEPA